MSGEPPSLAISPAALAACYADARKCYPEESCGLLLGPADAALCDEAHPCQNQQNRMHALDPERFPRDATTAYSLGLRDIRMLEDQAHSARPVKIIYHSHVDRGAYFSEEDHRAALFFDGTPTYPVDYLVISCHKDGVRGARLFCFRGGQFVAVSEFPGERGESPPS
jgi:adenylyltransferase/sulfurtransferase